MVAVEWIGHSSFKISGDGVTIYIDPWKLKRADRDADLVLVGHSHHDHYSASDIAKVCNEGTVIVGPGDVIKAQGQGKAVRPKDKIEIKIGNLSQDRETDCEKNNGVKSEKSVKGVKSKDVNVGLSQSGSESEDGNSYVITIEAVAAYNPAKQFHPKGNNWCGYVIGIGGKRIYFAGDTDFTEEMKALKGIDLALLPVGGTYTMDGEQAAEAVGYFKPKKAVPYHWGDIVGKREDAEGFAKKASCEVIILENGETINL